MMHEVLVICNHVYIQLCLVDITLHSICVRHAAEGSGPDRPAPPNTNQRAKEQMSNTRFERMPLWNFHWPMCPFLNVQQESCNFAAIGAPTMDDWRSGSACDSSLMEIPQGHPFKSGIVHLFFCSLVRAWRNFLLSVGICGD